MGKTVKKAKGSEIKIKFKVWGTAILLRVDILRFRFGKDDRFAPVESAAPRPESMDFEINLKDILDHDTIYYDRVVQEPLEWPGMAWTSPVWIDCLKK